MRKQISKSNFFLLALGLVLLASGLASSQSSQVVNDIVVPSGLHPVEGGPLSYKTVADPNVAVTNASLSTILLGGGGMGGDGVAVYKLHIIVHGTWSVADGAGSIADITSPATNTVSLLASKLSGQTEGIAAGNYELLIQLLNNNGAADATAWPIIGNAAVTLAELTTAATGGGGATDGIQVSNDSGTTFSALDGQTLAVGHMC